MIEQLKPYCGRISLFVDQDVKDLAVALELGVQRIEIYTGPYAHNFDSGIAEHDLSVCRATALEAESLGIGVNAGHDLNQKNLASFVAAFLSNIPHVQEVSIGHALFNDALYDGLQATVQSYLRIIAAAS